MILFSLLGPFFISFLTGYLFIDFLFRKGQKPDLLVHIFLAGGLGLGASAFITFFSFVFFNRLVKPFPVAVHLIILILLVVGKFLAAKEYKTRAFNYKSLDIKTTTPLILVLLAFIPVWMQAKFYPMGGWDAWSVWNFKAKFLLLAGDKWQNLLDPILWRTSPHYPFLLPLMNVWGWIFLHTALPDTPLITSVLFTFLIAGLLFSILRDMTKSCFSVAAPLLLLTLPFYGTLATSQYCDIVLGYFILAGLYCFLEGITGLRESNNIHICKKSNAKPSTDYHIPPGKVSNGRNYAYVLLSGLFLGFLSFAKPEGMVAAVLIACLGAVLLKADRSALDKKKLLAYFLIAFFLSSIPTIIFQILYSPGNQTFVNGFLSSSKPITLYRLKMILAFFLMELKSAKWNGLWILSAAGMILGWGKCFRKAARILPLFLALYIGITLMYYFTNTYFEIKWWLQSSLNRVLFSLLPTVLFWIFLTVFQSSESCISKRPKASQH